MDTYEKLKENVSDDNLESSNSVESQINCTTTNKDIDKLLHNLYIAHELAKNEDTNILFKLEAQSRIIPNIVKSKNTEEFWKTLKDQLSTKPPKLDMAFEILSEIKKCLELFMTPNVTKLRQQLCEILDLDMLRTETENGVIDIMFYVKYVISLMSKICAPVRDKSIVELSKKTDIIELFRGIVDILTLMGNDLLNFLLAIIKPDIMANHLSYERETFKEYIEAIGVKLPITEKWLLKYFQKNKTNNEIVHEAFLGILVWESVSDCPETFFLDKDHIRQLKQVYFRLTVSCTLMFLSLSLVPNDLLPIEDIFKKSLKSFLLIIMTEARNNEDVKNMSKNIATELYTRIKSDLKKKDNSKKIEINFNFLQETIEQASIPAHKIRVLVSNRINNYLKASLSVLPNNDIYFPSALHLFKPELNGLRVLFESLVKHNQAVCMELYERILTNDTCESLST